MPQLGLKWDRALVNSQRPFSWRDIDGWFNDADAEIYQRIARLAPKRGGIAEIGVWKGRSFCCLIQALQAAHKEPFLYAVDTFMGSEEHQPMQQSPLDLQWEFKANVIATRYPYWMLMATDSTSAARYISDDSLSAVFIDASHKQEHVEHDIITWTPKLRSNGIIAGHDYTSPMWSGVKLAVDKVLGADTIQTIGTCWMAVV